MTTKRFGQPEVWACLAFLALGLLVGVAISKSISGKLVLDILTMVGTVGAAVVALWLGLAAQHQQTAAAYDRALLRTAQVLEPLTAAIDDVLMAHQRWTSPVHSVYQALDEEGLMDAQRREIRKVATSPAFAIPYDILADLSALPHHAALDLAEGLSQLRRIAEQLADGAYVGHRSMVRSDLLNEATETLGRAHNHLAAAHLVMLWAYTRKHRQLVEGVRQG